MVYFVLLQIQLELCDILLKRLDDAVLCYVLLLALVQLFQLLVSFVKFELKLVYFDRGRISQ